LNRALNRSRARSSRPGGAFDPEKLGTEIGQLENSTATQDFWQNRDNAEKILSRLKRLKERFEPWQKLKAEIEELEELFRLAGETQDEAVEGELTRSFDEISGRFERLQMLELLGDELDDSHAILTIHAGAGGTEACDWAGMLLRMYTRWAERHGYAVETLDLLVAEGGVKSVTLQVTGDYAHGYLKGETGVHRLVRISPFDANARRHTSFASVYASPVIDDEVTVVIRPEDIRIDTYRSQGAGGQKVNKTDSAVRITHLATGIVVQCQNERSQYKNKANAMKVLRSRLYEHLKTEKEKENAKFLQEKKDISWGNQIRSYVFQPYTMVKDHRTKHETGNIQAVMDGGIDEFIEEYLKLAWASKAS